nr:hypothetical protein [Tanacetum cinerariifolium]
MKMTAIMIVTQEVKAVIKSDNGGDNAQSDNEKDLDSKHKIDENKMGSQSDQEENEEDDEEEKDDEFVKTL